MKNDTADGPQPFLPAGRADAKELAGQIKRVSGALSLSYLLDFPVAIMVLNGYRQIVYYNQRASDLMGPDHPDPLGLRAGEAFSCVHAHEGIDGCGTGPFCKYCGAARGLAAAISGIVGSEECTIDRSRTEKLEQLDLLVWTKPITINGDCLYLFAVIDISERKRRESLERVFLHDIMNTAGSLSSLMRLINPLEDTFSEYFALAREASDQLVDELVSHRMLSDAESGALPADFVMIAASEICASIAHIYGHIADSRGILFKLEKPVEALYLNTDPVLLKRVLGNLLKNAIEASARDQTVTLSYASKGSSIVFSVNNPAVIQDEVLSQIFHRSFSTKGRGRGLGTYSARLFTEEFLRGSIHVESEAGRGTTFTVTLPAVMQ